MNNTTQSIPDGYKLSEVGVIPNDWKTNLLGEECQLITKGTTPTSIGEDFKNSGISFIKIESLTDRGEIIKDKVAYIDERTNNLLRRSQLKDHDVLVSIAGALGRISIVTDDLLPANINQALAIVRLKNKSDLITSYLFHYLKSGKIQNHIQSISVQGAQANISLQNVNEFPIGIPSNKEQLAISSTLTDLDSLIQYTEKLIVKKRAIKHGAMQELLTGKRRLPGFNGKWEEKKLGDIAGFYKGRGLPKSDITEDGRNKCIHYGELFTKYAEEITNILSYTQINGDYLYSKTNDTLMPTSDVTPNGLATASCIKEDGVLLGGDILVIRPDSNLDGIYLSYCIANNRDQIMQLVTGTTVFHLYASDMKKFTFKLPKLDEQQAIVKVFSEMQKEIESLEHKLEKYNEIKQGAMQVLLTGKIRLIKN